MGDYSSLYKYEKFEIIGDELVPLGIFSVDGNGTMPLVVKDDCDPQCGCPEPIYRWIQTEDTVCIEVITYKLQATYSDSSTLNVECNSSTSLLKAESQPTGYTASAMTDAIIGDCVTTIGDSYYYTQAPFMNCYSLSSVTIPSSVTTIGKYAFYNCTSLTSVTIPSGVTSIYEAAFNRCSGLTAIYVEPTTPPALYGSEPFWNTGDCPIYVPCSSVSAYQAASGWSVYASRIEGVSPCSKYRWTPSGWTCVGYDKYQNNIKEQSTDGGETWTVVIPEEYSASTLIESQSTDCGYVPPTPSSPKFTLTLSDSSTVSAECDASSAITINEISAYTSSVVSVAIGDCVTTIGDEAFNNCMSLTSVTIPNSVTTIGDNAFNACDLHEINLPNTLINLGDGAFKYCQYLQDVDIPVGYVPNECFSHCPNLQDVDLSLNTTTIDFGAFSSCYSLESIDIPSAIETINYEAFKDCENLASVYVHATTPPTLRNDSFDGTPIADGTGTIYVPCESVSAYQAATNWSTYASRIQGIPPCGQPIEGKYQLTLSDSSIVTAACDSTSAITSGEVSSQYSGSVVSAVIGDCVTNIDRGTFMNCSGLTSVTIPNNVVTIGNIAFSRCYGLTNITIPSGVTVIGYQTFYVCTGLTSVEIPSGVTEIGISAFDICSSLTSVTIPNSVTTINENAFKDCHSLANLNIGSNVTTIGSSAFYWCNSLTSVTIPNGVTTIGMQAFSRCSGLTSIEIPSNVTSIGAGAFMYCTSLQSITCLASTPPTLGNNAFYDTNNCPIYVPSASVNDYKAVWSNYSSRIQPIT